MKKARVPFHCHGGGIVKSVRRRVKQMGLRAKRASYRLASLLVTPFNKAFKRVAAWTDPTALNDTSADLKQRIQDSNTNTNG